MLTPAADWVLIRFYCAFMLRVTENSCKVKTRMKTSWSSYSINYNTEKIRQCILTHIVTEI